MTHVVVEYTRQQLLGEQDHGLYVVELLIGPAPRAVRPAGTLHLHPLELNALDRLLSRGALFEQPANTYALRRSRRELEDALPARRLPIGVAR